jgi:hypothetical protein
LSISLPSKRNYRLRQGQNSDCRVATLTSIGSSASRPCLEDATLALVQPGEPADAVVGQPILPFAGVPSSRIGELSDTSPPKPAVCVDQVLLGHAQPLGDELDLIRA